MEIFYHVGRFYLVVWRGLTATKTETTGSNHAQNVLVRQCFAVLLETTRVYRLELSAGLMSMWIPAAAALLAKDCRKSSWSLLHPANSLVVITTFNPFWGVSRARIRGYVAC